MSSQEAELVIHGGTVVGEAGAVAASVAVAGGRIVAIGAAEAMPPAARVIDAAGRHLLPGAIDVHVHFRDPGLTHKEDWASGTRAAALGGVTTVFDMPNTVPPTATAEAFAQKQAAAAAQAVVDYGIYGLLDAGNLDLLPALAEAGAVGFKLFMGNTTGHLPSPEDGAVLEGFEIIARTGLRCTVHAENASITNWREARIRPVRGDALAHQAARPEIAELEALGRALTLAEWTGCRLHVAHVTLGESAQLIRQAKARGIDVTAETCPHYLLLSAEDMAAPGGEVLRCNPPLRPAGNGAALLAALADGTLDLIASDHAPHLPHEKHGHSIWDCACGLPGVETMVPLMLTLVAEGRLTLTDYARIAAANPARAFGLYPRKGVLAVGSDADIVIADLGRRDVIRAARLASRAGATPFEGRPVQGVPVTTLVRGRIVADAGRIVAEPGWGKLVRPAMSPPQPRNADQALAAVSRSRS